MKLPRLQASNVVSGANPPVTAMYRILVSLPITSRIEVRFAQGPILNSTMWGLADGSKVVGMALTLEPMGQLVVHIEVVELHGWPLCGRSCTSMREVVWSSDRLNARSVPGERVLQERS